jgi:hypothetical protein
MKNTLKKFTIWIPTKFGAGCINMKANDFQDAFRRLGKKDKLKDGMITDEDGESKTFNEICGIEETI